jgi:hypothetical protein
MDLKTYTKVSVVNLVFLFSGILISPAIVKSVDMLRVVHAQDEKSAPKPPAKVEAPKPAAVPAECENATCVTPGVGMPSAAIGTLLVHEGAFDVLMVNGFELIKLHDLTLGALQAKGILNAAEVQAIVSKAKAEKPLRVKPQAQ